MPDLDLYPFQAARSRLRFRELPAPAAIGRHVAASTRGPGRVPLHPLPRTVARPLKLLAVAIEQPLAQQKRQDILPGDDLTRLQQANSLGLDSIPPACVSLVSPRLQFVGRPIGIFCRVDLRDQILTLKSPLKPLVPLSELLHTVELCNPRLEILFTLLLGPSLRSMLLPLAKCALQLGNPIGERGILVGESLVAVLTATARLRVKKVVKLVV